MKNIIYQTCSFQDAEAYRNRNSDKNKFIQKLYIDSHVSDRRTDAYGELLEQFHYEVYEIV